MREPTSNPKISNPPFRLRKSKIENRKSSGVALIMTLAIIALVTALVLTLFLTVTTERVESSAASDHSDSKRLANSVVDLVKSTITQATTGYEADLTTGVADTSKLTAWASQPGMIRTWKQDGTADRSFRLYSSGNLVTAGALNLTTEQTDLMEWKTNAPAGSSYNALWCDLNAPALNEIGTRIFPIVTPPSDTNSGSTAIDATDGVPTDNPTSPTQEGVQGFAITSAPGYSGSDPAPANNPAPMPVKWLYVLQDGTFVSPTGSTINATIAGATAANPIVSRVAYWTDDETCKVNINTASEGNFWDTPKADGIGERNLAINSPVRGEYQRIAGHPAMVSLSAVRSEFSSGSASDFQNIYSATPKTKWGGSENGQKPFPLPIFSPYPGNDPRAGLPGNWATRASSMAPLLPKPDRLYASPNEFLYDPARGYNPPYTAATVNTIGNKSFFLTASSKAPETTLFETPRISIWPMTWPVGANTASNWQTQNPSMAPEEKLLAFCATLNTNRYFYQRRNSQSATDDFVGITRNQQVYDYLRTSMDKQIPGFGATFRSKFGDDSEQILTSCFDYVRSGVNLANQSAVNSSGVATPYYYATRYFRGVFTSGGGTVVPIKITGHGPATRGLGHGAGISEVGLQFIATEREEPVPSAVDPNLRKFINFGEQDTTLYPIGSRTTKIQMVMLAEFFRSLTGYISLNPGFAIVVKGPSFQIDGQPINFPSAAGLTNYCALQVNTASYLNSELGPFMGVSWMLGKDIRNGDGFGAKTLDRSGYSTTRFPLYGDKVSVDPTKTTFTFAGSAVELEIWSVDLSNSSRPLRDKLQTINLDFTKLDGTYPMPFAPRYDNSAIPTTPVPVVPIPDSETYRAGGYFYSSGASNDMRDLFTRMNATVNAGNPTNIGGPGPAGVSGFNQPIIAIYRDRSNVLRSPDTLISMQLDPAGPAQGDLRLLQLRENVPMSWFAPHPKTLAIRNLVSPNLSVDRAAHGMWFLGNPTFHSANSKNRPTDFLNETLLDTPMIRSAVSGVKTSIVGDWNNGLGGTADGAIIPKPVDTFLTLSADPLDGSLKTPFFDEYNGLLSGAGSYFSPVRQIPSPVLFGSLPAQVLGSVPWRNLLFNPNPRQGNSHPGFTSPPDHLLLDLFWMPVVEPYAISEPLSTSGKININQQIAPFNYIQRETGLYALLKSVKVTAIPKSSAMNYKLPDENYGGMKDPSLRLSTPSNPGNFRYSLKLPETIQGFRDRWTASGPFKSASEVCEMFLVPDGITGVSDIASTKAWWSGNAASSPVLTGANSRQQPYSHIYQLATTKSNTFTVHYRVQTLKKIKSDPNQNTWVEAKDVVESEFRGSATIERYVDPNDTSIPDFALPANAGKNLSSSYRWRTVEQKQFLP